MNRRDAERQRLNKITEKIIGAAIEVHRVLGPGLLESVYEECLCYELEMAGLKIRRQVELPVIYKEVKLDRGFRLLPIHEAQLLTHLKLTNKNLGLLINFNVPLLKEGIKRIVHNF